MGFVRHGQGLPQLLQPPFPLEVVWVGEKATKAQANKHDTDKNLMIQSLPLFKEQNWQSISSCHSGRGSGEERLLWAGGLAAVVPPRQGMPSSMSVQFVFFPCVAGEYLQPMLAKALTCFLPSLQEPWWC